MGARYYAAWLGRWTSADPMGIGADGPGLYNYTRGSPVVFTDPGGMEGGKPSDDLLGQLGDLGSSLLSGVASTAASISPEDIQREVARKEVANKGEFDPAMILVPDFAKGAATDVQIAFASARANLMQTPRTPSPQERDTRSYIEQGYDYVKGEGGFVKVLLWPRSAEANYQSMTSNPEHQRIGPPPQVDLTGPIVQQTPAIAFSLWSTFVGNLRTPTLKPIAPPPDQLVSVRQATLAEGLEVADLLAWERQIPLKGISGGGRNRPNVVIGAFDEASGEASAFESSIGRQFPSFHAEDAAQANMPGAKMTQPIRVKSGEYWTVCKGCEDKYGRDLFVEGTRFERDLK